MNLREAAQQALEELVAADGMPICNETDILDLSKTIEALRAALAEDAMQRLTDVQQEMEPTIKDNLTVEPVAYVTGYSKGRCIIEAVDPAWLLPVGMALYRSPTINEMETVEPVAWMWLNTGTFRKRLPKTAVAENWTPLYTAPPKRTPLTIGQLFDLYNEHAKCQQEDWLVSGWLAFAWAIERAHDIGGELWVEAEPGPEAFARAIERAHDIGGGE